MQLYELSPTAGVPSTWFGTKGEAHDCAKLKAARGDVRIYLWEVPTDKASIIGMINGRSPRPEFRVPPLAAWGLTSRGGLLEIPIDKALKDLADEEPPKATAPTAEELEEL